MLKRLGVFYGEAQVAAIAKEMEDAATGAVLARGEFELPPVDEAVGGGRKGNGKEAREGLARLLRGRFGA